MYVKSHGEDKEPRFVVLFTPGQEAPEAVILLQNAENSLYLYRSVHAENYSFGGRDALLGLFLLAAHCFGELYLPVLVLSLEALLPVRATGAALTDVIALCHGKAVIGFYVLISLLDQI